MFELVEEQWEKIQLVLKNEFGLDIYNAWLSRLNCVAIRNNKIELSVETNFIKDYIVKEYLEGKYTKSICRKKGLKQILKDNFDINIIDISINNKKNGEQTQTLNNVKSISPTENLYTIGTELNKLYTFENFVVGESNKLAFSIAKSIVDGDTVVQDVNPLFIYGGVGLGKTHLIQSMAWALKDKYKNKNITYLSAERFMALFVNALRDKTINDFKDRFKNIDTLIIDDLQFIAGKTGTQKEFFYTFNTLLAEGKTMIMACDKSPDKLSEVDEKLKSRISGGIIVDITPSDYDLRLKLAKSKAELYGLKCDSIVLEKIAERTNNTNRDIDGLIKNLLIKHYYSKKEINLSTLDDILPQKTKKNNIETIQKKVCEHFGLTKNDIFSNTRKYALERQIAFYLSRKYLPNSYPEIARFYNKNHATIIFACKKIEKEIIENNKIRNIVETIESSF
jgi:chromosomal replication initiator protein